MKYVSKSMNVEFRAIQARRSTPKTVLLCKVLKSGKLGVAREEHLYGSETSAEDVIARLEKLNPGSHWVKA